VEIEVEMPKPFLKRLIISPDAKWKSVFDIWVLLFVGYSCIWNILVFAFTFTTSKNLEYFNLIIEFVFQLDFFLTFFQSYKHPETYEVIDDYKLIAINYFWGWFWIDLISIFPFTLFLNNSGAQDSAQTVKLARLFRMPRLGKLIDINRIKKLFKSFQGDAGDDKKIVKQYLYLYLYNMFRLILIAVILTYFIGCFWFWISYNQMDWFTDPEVALLSNTWYLEFGLENLSLRGQIVTSCYFALTTLATVGYGDYYPISWIE
jgi:hypothetical protein